MDLALMVIVDKDRNVVATIHSFMVDAAKVKAAFGDVQPIRLGVLKRDDKVCFDKAVVFINGDKQTIYL